MPLIIQIPFLIYSTAAIFITLIAPLSFFMQTEAHNFPKQIDILLADLVLLLEGAISALSNVLLQDIGFSMAGY